MLNNIFINDIIIYTSLIKNVMYRLLNSKRMEGDAFVQKYSSQPRVLF